MRRTVYFFPPWAILVVRPWRQNFTHLGKTSENSPAYIFFMYISLYISIYFYFLIHWFLQNVIAAVKMDHYLDKSVALHTINIIICSDLPFKKFKFLKLNSISVKGICFIYICTYHICAEKMTTFLKLKSFPVSSASSPSPFCGDVFYSKSLIPLKDQKREAETETF